MNSEIIPILILVLITIVLAVYTVLGMRWWLEKKEKTSNPWLQFGLGWVVIAVVVFAPMCLLMFSIDELKSWKGIDIGGNGRFLALFGWIMPTGIYGITYIIRKSRPIR